MFCIVTPTPADRWQHDCCSYVSTHLRFDHAIKITIVDNYAQLSTIGASTRRYTPYPTTPRRYLSLLRRS